jgi:hypothetical protein
MLITLYILAPLDHHQVSINGNNKYTAFMLNYNANIYKYSNLNGGHRALCCVCFFGEGNVTADFCLKCVQSCYKWYNIDTLIFMYLHALFLDHVISVMQKYSYEFLYLLHQLRYSCNL